MVSSLVFSVSAENVLILTDPQTKETETFRKGSFMVFELRSDKTIREGFIREIQDSSLSFEDLMFEAQVSLSEIHILAGTTKGKVNAGKVANAVGNVLIIAGSTVFDCGLNFMVNSDYYYWPLGGSIWVAGAVIAGLGYVFDWAAHPLDHTVRVRNYREWEASIVNEGLPAVSVKETAPADPLPAQPKDTVQPVVPPVQEAPAKKKRKIQDDDVYGQ